MLRQNGTTYRVIAEKKDESSSTNVDKNVLGKGQFGQVRKIVIESNVHGTFSCAEKSPNIDLYTEVKPEFICESFQQFGTHGSIVSELLVLNSVSSGASQQQQHPSSKLIRLFDVVRDENKRDIRILMEMGDYNLRQYMEEKRVPLHVLMSINCTKEVRLETVEQYMNIAHDLFVAMHELHTNGFIYHDLTPSNVMILDAVVGESLVKLVDFGLSELQCGWKGFARDKVTWPYRAPEICVSSPDYTESADVWSIGAVMCELFFFHRLFDFCKITDAELPERMWHIFGYPNNEWCARFCPMLMKPGVTTTTLNQIYDSDMSSAQRQQYMTRFLELLIPSQTKRDLVFQLYGYKLTITITQMILSCLSFEPRHRPTAYQLCVWDGFFGFFGPNNCTMNDLNPIYVPRLPLLQRGLFAMNAQIESWLKSFFKSQPCMYYPFLIALQHTCCRIHEGLTRQQEIKAIPLHHSLICECLAVSICLKWFRMFDEPGEKGEKLRERVRKLCKVESNLFNDYEQAMLHEQLGWTL
jgi:serine/threonine protein kinase